MHRIGVTAADLPAENPSAGAISDIGVEQHRSGAAQADDLNIARQRRHQRSDCVQMFVRETARLFGGPARRMSYPVQEQKRQRDIIGDALAAQVRQDREALALRTVRVGSDLDTFLDHDGERTVPELGRMLEIEIDSTDLDLGSQPPDEAAAEYFGMQGADEDADTPQRQACLHQTLAAFGHHPARRGCGARTVNQPVGNVLQLERIHDACICRRSSRAVKSQRTLCVSRVPLTALPTRNLPETARMHHAKVK